MNHQDDLALAKQAFEQVLALCDPEHVHAWQPTAEQRRTYLQLGERALDGFARLEMLEKRRLLKEGRLQNTIPDTLLAFVQQLRPRSRALRSALDYLDPDPCSMILRGMWDPIRDVTSRGVRATFEDGIQEIYEMIERNPHWGGDHPFRPDSACEILDSKLIQFDPDVWLDRVSELRPIRNHNQNFVLPSQVRLRLEELYRVYVFGLWLSVFGLSRAIFEYAIHDNLRKFRIESTWPPDRDGKRREKKLSDLIGEVAEFLPRYLEPMTLIRDQGNEYLHPRKNRVNNLLFQRQASAKEVVEKLVEVVEALYGVQGKA